MLIKLFGMILIVFGTILLLKPTLLKTIIAFWQQGKRVYFGGIISLLIGIVFLIFASSFKFMTIPITLGLIAIGKAIFIFTLKFETLQGILSWWQKRSLLVLRLAGSIDLIIGILFIIAS